MTSIVQAATAPSLIRMAAAMLTILAGLSGAAASARAQDSLLLVLKSTSDELPAGRVINGGDRLTLAGGRQLHLVDDAGRLRVLAGPFAGRPVDQAVRADSAAETAGGRLDILRALLAERQGSGALRGDLRSGDARPAKPPGPWAVSVDRGGAACAQPDRVTFWRTDTQDEARISIEMGARKANAVWKRGAELLPMPAGLFVNGRTYKAQIEGRPPVEITLHVAAAAAASPIDQAVWMASVGCKLQALWVLDGLE